MTTRLSGAPEASPLFFPHELSPDGIPSTAAVRRAFPMKNDTRTDDELHSIGRWIVRFEQTFATIISIKREEAFQAKVKKRLANHRKYVQRKAKRREGEK